MPRSRFGLKRPDAEPGSVLVSYETFAQVREVIEREELGALQVEGIVYPIAAYRVVDLKANRAANEHGARTILPHLRLEAEPYLMSPAERDEAAKALRRVDAAQRVTGVGRKRRAGLIPKALGEIDLRHNRRLLIWVAALSRLGMPTDTANPTTGMRFRKWAREERQRARIDSRLRPGRCMLRNSAGERGATSRPWWPVSATLQSLPVVSRAQVPDESP
jgi:hypothetical protein